MNNLFEILSPCSQGQPVALELNTLNQTFTMIFLVICCYWHNWHIFSFTTVSSAVKLQSAFTMPLLFQQHVSFHVCMTLHTVGTRRLIECVLGEGLTIIVVLVSVRGCGPGGPKKIKQNKQHKSRMRLSQNSHVDFTSSRSHSQTVRRTEAVAFRVNCDCIYAEFLSTSHRIVDTESQVSL